MVNTITITPNGNSPETKMNRASFEIFDHDSVASESIQENKKHSAFGLKKYQNKLPINERYRRLIPYMTFYYANDLVAPPEHYPTKTVEVEKAEIVEARPITPREPKSFSSQRHKNIPRYFGNRLTQYNIASANPTKLYYNTISPALYQNSHKLSTNYNPAYVEPNTFEYSDRTYERLVPKHYKPLHQQYSSIGKPQQIVYHNDDNANVQYYSSEKEENPTYRLVPYEQSPPVKVISPNRYITIPHKQYEATNIPVNEKLYIKPKPEPPQYTTYEKVYLREEKVRKPPVTVSELYYEQKPSVVESPKHIALENGFNPIIDPSITVKETQIFNQDLESSLIDVNNNKEEYVHKEATYLPVYNEKPSYVPFKPETSTPATISNLLNSLHLHKPIPKNLTRNNIGSSITTLLRVLNALKAMPQQSKIEESAIEITERPPNTYDHSPTFGSTSAQGPATIDSQGPEFQEEAYLSPVNPPSQHLDDIPTHTTGGTSQRFPQLINSDEEGGTPGKPGIDYPTLTVIPETSFDCKTQRYKGFFADTETRCQVWHYCDLNGGQASFLCPNGTIFSQAGLTCDWWFNVKCASTTQLYVLNESLYKFILPHSPKFPEDYSGPLVDKYLSLKFKEMEEQFRKNKNKAAKDKEDSSDDSEKDTETSTEAEERSNNVESVIEEGHVNVQSAGSSGNVERLQEE